MKFLPFGYSIRFNVYFNDPSFWNGIKSQNNFQSVVREGQVTAVLSLSSARRRSSGIVR